MAVVSRFTISVNGHAR